MKKIVVGILIASIVILLLVANREKNQVKGEGTREKPLLISDINKINELERIFIDKYNGIFEDSLISYNDQIDSMWQKEKRSNESIEIESVHYIGNQMQSNMMIIYTCDGVEKELKQDVLNRFKEDKFMVTTSYHSLEIDLNKKVDTSLFKESNADAFTLRLADDILNDNAKMIVTYNINYEKKWYQLSTLIHIDKPTYLQIPKQIFGEGKIANNEFPS